MISCILSFAFSSRVIFATSIVTSIWCYHLLFRPQRVIALTNRITFRHLNARWNPLHAGVSLRSILMRHFLCIYSQTKGKVFVLIDNQHIYSKSYLNLHTTTKNWIYLHMYHKSRDWHCLRRYGVWPQVWITCHHCLEREIKAVKSMVNEMIFKDTRYNCLPSAYYFVYVRWKCPNGHYVVQSMRLVHLYKDHNS